MLHDKVSLDFNELIKKYNRKTWPNDFKSKFGNLFKGLTISLGTWVKILEDIENKDLEPDIKEFIKILLAKYDRPACSIIEDACNELSLERNPRSHYESLTMKQVINLRKRMVRHLNRVIKLLF